MITLFAIFGALVLAWATARKHPFVALLLLASTILLAAAAAPAQAEVAGPSGPHVDTKPGDGLRCLRLPGPFAACKGQQGRRKGQQGHRGRHRGHRAAHTRGKRCARVRRQYVRRHGATTPRNLRGMKGCEKWKADARFHQHDDSNPAMKFITTIIEEL